MTSHNSLHSEEQPSQLPLYSQHNLVNKSYKHCMKSNSNRHLELNDNLSINKKHLLTIHKTTTNIQNNNYITYNFNNG